MHPVIHATAIFEPNIKQAESCIYLLPLFYKERYAHDISMSV
jgi:hypothetical protein